MIDEYPHIARVYFISTPPGVGSWHSQAIRILTGSKIVHVCIGNSRRVLDPNVRKENLWRRDDFERMYPRISHYMHVRCRHPVIVNATREGRLKVLPTVARFATNGKWPETDDCVQVTCRVLRRAGVPVPLRMTTPIGLFRWLAKEAILANPQ